MARHFLGHGEAKAQVVAQHDGHGYRIVRTPEPGPRDGFVSLHDTRLILERAEQDALGVVSWRLVEATGASPPEQALHSLMNWLVETTKALSALATEGKAGAFEFAEAAESLTRFVKATQAIDETPAS